MLNLIASTMALSLAASAPLPTPGFVGLVAAAPTAQPDENEPVMRVYDLRGLQSYASIQDAGAPRDRLRELVSRMSEAAELDDWRELIDGVFAVWATPPSHDRLDELIGTIQGLFDDRYSVSVACYVPTTEQRKGVGESFTDEDQDGYFAEEVRVDQAIFEGGSATLGSTVRHQYIASWMPVVGNSAIAYQPEVKQEIEGLETLVLVNEASGGRVRVELNGWYRSLDLRPLTFEQGIIAGLMLEMPEVFELTLDANLVIEPGVPTVAVSNDALIVVVTVRSAEND